MPQSKPDELQPDNSAKLLAIRQHILNAQNLVHKLKLSDNNPLLIHNNTEIDNHPQDCPACNIWHVWMNRLNDGKTADEWDHSIYLWKDALSFVQYGHQRIKQAFDGTLPATHQQCSLSAPEAIEKNTLRCCLGQEVTTCPMLLQIRAIHEEHWNRPVVECSGYNPGKHYRESVSQEDMYRTMAKTCAWHVYEESKKHFVDASEGFHLDESDRRFWRNVYDSMAGGDFDSPVSDGEAG